MYESLINGENKSYLKGYHYQAVSNKVHMSSS